MTSFPSRNISLSGYFRNCSVGIKLIFLIQYVCFNSINIFRSSRCARHTNTLPCRLSADPAVSSFPTWWQVALLAGHHPIFVSSASWCRQFRDVGIFVLQTSFSSLCQDVTELQHRKAVSQWLAHRRGIVCLRACVSLLFNFHVDRSRRI